VRGGKEEYYRKNSGAIESTKRRSGLFCNGIFNGSKWREKIAPIVENWIAKHN
jgi:poly-beta-hydroxyalkanoate depolymerase